MNGVFLQVDDVTIRVTDIERETWPDPQAFAEAVKLKVRAALDPIIPGSLTRLTWPM